MQHIVARHNITIYHTCILHSVINVFCTFVQKRCYIIDAKDSEIQYFKVHITNSLQLSAAKLLLFYDMQVFGQEFSEFVKFAFKILYFGNCIGFLNVGIILEKVWKWCVLIKNEIILKKSVEIFVYIKNF